MWIISHKVFAVYKSCNVRSYHFIYLLNIRPSFIFPFPFPFKTLFLAQWVSIVRAPFFVFTQIPCLPFIQNLAIDFLSLHTDWHRKIWANGLNAEVKTNFIIGEFSYGFKQLLLNCILLSIVRFSFRSISMGNCHIYLVTSLFRFEMFAFWFRLLFTLSFIQSVVRSLVLANQKWMNKSFHAMLCNYLIVVYCKPTNFTGHISRNNHNL